MSEVLIGILSSSSVAAIITAIITAINNRKGRDKMIEDTLKDIGQKLDKIREEQDKSEKDLLRTQLLLLIADYPDNEEGILTAAQRYFGELHANWYATPIFNRWLEDRKIARPEWFK